MNDLCRERQSTLLKQRNFILSLYILASLYLLVACTFLKLRPVLNYRQGCSCEHLEAKFSKESLSSILNLPEMEKNPCFRTKLRIITCYRMYTNKTSELDFRSDRRQPIRSKDCDYLTNQHAPKLTNGKPVICI